ncbi:MAG: twin-arginine translocase subunit TatC [Alistipes finegoldii]
MTGLVLAMPLRPREFWRFVKPALTQRETPPRTACILISACFFTGLLFGYFVIVPLSVSFRQLRSQRFDREHDRRQSALFDRHRHRWPRRWCSSRRWSTS